MCNIIAETDDFAHDDLLTLSDIRCLIVEKSTFEGIVSVSVVVKVSSCKHEEKKKKGSLPIPFSLRSGSIVEVRIVFRHILKKKLFLLINYSL